MRGPPLGPLLPLLLILNTASVNPESTASYDTGDRASQFTFYTPTSYYGRTVKFQRKVAEDTVFLSTKMSPVQHVESDQIVECIDCDHIKLFRPVRSGSAVKKDLKILSQILESVDNSTSSPLEIDSLVRSKNDSRMSSLGSVDVVVPSITDSDVKSVDNKWNITSILQFLANSRNRSGNVQRLGRTDAPMLNYIFDTYSTLNKHQHRNDRFGSPKIESSIGKVEVDTDAEAQLDCRVSSLQDKLVSWVRRRPDNDSLELLTIAQQAYTADSRFSVDFLQPDNWRLLLKPAKPPDSGLYECQISTHPPMISRVELVVNAPVVSIVEAGGRELRDKYYERNSTLKLACRIRHLAAASHTPVVNWLHSDRILNDDTLRGGVSVRTEAVEGGADSTLLVARLNSSDSGRYTCSVGTDLFAVVNVHVLNGESLAELHQGAALKLCSPSLTNLVLISMLITLISNNIIAQVFYSTIRNFIFLKYQNGISSV